MGNSVIKNALLLILALSVGFALGTVTKFGFGYDLSLKSKHNTPPLLVVGHKRNSHE